MGGAAAAGAEVGVGWGGYSGGCSGGCSGGWSGAAAALRLRGWCGGGSGGMQRPSSRPKERQKTFTTCELVTLECSHFPLKDPNTQKELQAALNFISDYRKVSNTNTLKAVISQKLLSGIFHLL